MGKKFYSISMSRRQSKEKFEAELSAVLPTITSSYVGKVIFVPGPTEVAEVLGYSRGMMYHWGTNYEEKVATAFGLSVIHNGVVLGNESRVVRPDDRSESEEVRDIEARIQDLSRDERARLVIKLATDQ